MPAKIAIVNKKINWVPLFSSNFLGVLNDNLLKNLICFISIYWFPTEYHSTIISLATGFMVLPYILFSPFSGFLSKTFYKQKIVFYAKFAEIPIMTMAFTGFWIENIYVVMTAMFFMGFQSAMYSPAKFGLITDIGGEESISFGTGFIEALTFLGVLIGTFLAGIVSDVKEHRLIVIAIAFAIVSFSGFISSTFIKATESKPLKKGKLPLNSINFILRNHKWSKLNVPGLNNAVFGLSAFWLIGSLIQLNMLVHCPQTLKMTNTQTGIVMALVAISIGFGTWLSGVISRKNVELGLIPIGGVGLAFFDTVIFIFNPNGTIFTILIMLAAFSAGIMKTPINAWMQKNVKGRKIGDAIAYNNLINFVFILISAGIFGIVENIFGTRVVFAVIALFAWYLVYFLSNNLDGVRESFKRVMRLKD
ncbi:MAG: hypothetical protein A2W98_03090 [Bacteroidetes bacterium GWF2_33_38]|nr:MAG: hypothetical protein A2W98_03090 [Bacteroidetes bacterium GWF2_33_38]OFY75237.1 MAG: hypothetical protein A2265_05485 [Bacteroidetes bacterium RIFOXYA12_FULL_33_9]